MKAEIRNGTLYVESESDYEKNELRRLLNGNVWSSAGLVVKAKQEQERVLAGSPERNES